MWWNILYFFKFFWEFYVILFRFEARKGILHYVNMFFLWDIYFLLKIILFITIWQLCPVEFDPPEAHLVLCVPFLSLPASLTNSSCFLLFHFLNESRLVAQLILGVESALEHGRPMTSHIIREHWFSLSQQLLKGNSCSAGGGISGCLTPFMLGCCLSWLCASRTHAGTIAVKSCVQPSYYQWFWQLPYPLFSKLQSAENHLKTIQIHCGHHLRF